MDNDVVQDMPVFRAGVLPGGLDFALSLEQGVCNGQSMLRAESEEVEIVVVKLANTVLAEHILP